MLLAGSVSIQRSSVSSAGEEADHASDRPSLSRSGRFVAFESTATNLVAGDTNSSTDVFVRDHEAQTTQRVSVGRTGNEANGASRNPSISGNGRYVAFETDASNAVRHDTDGKTDIVVRDRRRGTNTLVSVDPTGGPITDAAIHPVVSGNGRFVVFNVNKSFGNFCCVELGPYVRDLVNQTTTAMPTQGWLIWSQTTISDDGSRVAYGLVQPPSDPGAEEAPFAVVVADVPSATVIATIDSGIVTATRYFDVALSGNGRKVAYVFVTNNVGTLSRYNLDHPGLHQILTGLGAPSQTALSADGQVIAMRIVDSGYRYVVTDPLGSTPQVVSTNAIGTIASSVDGTDLSADGKWVAFATPDPNMVPGDTNGVSDAFIRSK